MNSLTVFFAATTLFLGFNWLSPIIPWPKETPKVISIIQEEKNCTDSGGEFYIRDYYTNYYYGERPESRFSLKCYKKKIETKQVESSEVVWEKSVGKGF